MYKLAQHESASWSRRRFLRASCGAGAAIGVTILLPRPARALQQGIPGSVAPHFLLDDPTWKAFAQRGIDAAHQAGAQYADVRLTRTIIQKHIGRGVTDTELLGVGVRALMNGCWGFASSPYWMGDETALLGRMAAEEARTTARVTPGTLALSSLPTVSGGWIMPVTIDPFTIPMEEKRDFLGSWKALAMAYAAQLGVHVEQIPYWTMTFTRQEQAVATSDGSYVTQVVYQTNLDGPVQFWFDPNNMDKIISRRIQHVDLSASGWEYLLAARVPEQMPVLYDEAVELAKLPRKPAEPGRVDVVFDAETTTRLIDQSIGLATELDRVLGDEANANGTSFLGPDVMKMLGQQIGSPLVTITGDRSMPGGLASVKWDAEAVAPDTITLVEKGIVHDYQTIRSGVPDLASWYDTQQRPHRSHGCASAVSALDVTIQTPPNLTLEPGTGGDFDSLVASLSKGLAVQGAMVTSDFQAKYGLVKGGVVREIVNGKLGAVVRNAGFLFETTELWKNVLALGGIQSARQYPVWREKGEPAQRIPYTVRAVPMAVRNVATIDVTHR